MKRVSEMGIRFINFKPYIIDWNSLLLAHLEIFEWQ